MAGAGPGPGSSGEVGRLSLLNSVEPHAEQLSLGELLMALQELQYLA